MQSSQKNMIRYAVIAAILLMIACCCRYVNVAEAYFDASNTFVHVILPTIKSTLRHMIHISLVLAWCVSLRARILDKRICSHMMSVGFLVILWLLIRVCKWEFVLSYDDTFVRYLWYGFYIPIILLPLQGVFIADLVGRPEGYRTPKWMDWLYVPALLLILLVFTNDLHRLVFSFPAGIGQFNQNYVHGALYAVIILWLVVLVLWFLVTLLKKNRVPGSSRYQTFPFVILAGFAAVWIIHTTNLIPNDQTLLNCLLIILLLESQIQTGLIRSNSNYDALFRQATIAAQIVDDAYTPRYVSRTAVQADESLLRRSEEETVRSGDLLLHSKPISGGCVLWQDNIKEINEALEELQETREQLGEIYKLKKAEVSLKERKFRAEEKSRLYDRIAHRISPQLVRADEILTQARRDPGNARGSLAQICVISAYIKRWSNLLLVGEERQQVPASELESCLRESMDNLRLADVITYLDGRCEDMLSVRDAAEIYQLFERVIEHGLGEINALVVSLDIWNGAVRFRMQVGFHTMPAGRELPALTVPGGTVTCQVQEEDLEIDVRLGERGGAA